MAQMGDLAVTVSAGNLEHRHQAAGPRNGCVWVAAVSAPPSTQRMDAGRKGRSDAARRIDRSRLQIISITEIPSFKSQLPLHQLSLNSPHAGLLAKIVFAPIDRVLSVIVWLLKKEPKQ